MYTLCGKKFLVADGMVFLQKSWSTIERKCLVPSVSFPHRVKQGIRAGMPAACVTVNACLR